jgi:hypothetical protein
MGLIDPVETLTTGCYEAPQNLCEPVSAAGLSLPMKGYNAVV